MARSIKRFRLLILCLALISFIIGMALISNFEFPDKLPLMLITDALTVIFYASFTYGSKRARQNKALRIFLRLFLAFLTVFGPLQALRQCTFRMKRDYDQREPGIVFFERIDCDDSAISAGRGEKSMLPVFRLFRARCIITLTVCVLIVLEMFFYGWSDEAKGLPQDETAATKESRNDVELANTSLNGPQKTVLVESTTLHFCSMNRL